MNGAYCAVLDSGNTLVVNVQTHLITDILNPSRQTLLGQNTDSSILPGKRYRGIAPCERKRAVGTIRRSKRRKQQKRREKEHNSGPTGYHSVAFTLHRQAEILYYR
jgi:hypothetical protein